MFFHLSFSYSLQQQKRTDHYIPHLLHKSHDTRSVRDIGCRMQHIDIPIQDNFLSPGKLRSNNVFLINGVRIQDGFLGGMTLGCPLFARQFDQMTKDTPSGIVVFLGKSQQDGIGILIGRATRILMPRMGNLTIGNAHNVNQVRLGLGTTQGTNGIQKIISRGSGRSQEFVQDFCECGHAQHDATIIGSPSLTFPRSLERGIG
mmetsp:Transcript_29906/g.62517  ORF Transcript_29906/g.62517 Transcript_29906/m.62517 type:complete len:203 (+) Transcript_29906:2857-3465(+)